MVKNKSNMLRWCIRFLALMVFVVVGAQSERAEAAGTPAGTAIRNFATVHYKDKNGTAQPEIKSNVITTIVAQVAAVDISPATAAENVVKGSTTVFNFQVANLGNGPDTFDLGKTNVPSGWSTAIYKDLDGDGILDSEERSSGNIVTNIGLTADQVVTLFLEVTAPSTAQDADKVPVTVTAKSTFDSAVTDAGTFTATITAAVVSIATSATPAQRQPGELVTYELQLTNSGSNTASNVVIGVPLPTGLTYVPGSIRLGGSGATYDTAQPATDTKDSDRADFGATAGNTVTVNWGALEGQKEGVIFILAKVDDGVLSGTAISIVATVNYESPAGQKNPALTTDPAVVTVKTLANPLVSISQAGYAEPSESKNYPFPITNGGNTVDRFDLETASTGGFENKIWVDTNNDGIPGNGSDYLLTDTDGDGFVDTGDMQPNEVIHLILEVFVPKGASDGQVDKTTLRVTPTSDPTALATGTLTTTVKAPVITVVKSVEPQGAQPPQQELTYNIVVTNTGSGVAYDVVVHDRVPVHTTYVTNSGLVDGVTRTDAADGDILQIDNREIVVKFGAIGPSGSHTITFKVNID